VPRPWADRKGNGILQGVAFKKVQPAAGHFDPNSLMRVNIEKAVQPLERLRKLLKKIPPDLAPEYVHKLRTQSRKLEATAHAISPPRDRGARRLMKLIKPVRKTAGKVRDMDVMIEKLVSIAKGMGNDGGDAILRLTEKMGAARERSADRLGELLKQKRKSARKKLRRFAKRVKKAGSDQKTESEATPQILAAELQHWPRLKPENLHEFRIHAKELRYILQLEPGIDEHILNAFARLKDVAGEWHDWLQLRQFAAKVLDNKENHEILRRLSGIEREKLRAAMAAANAVRRNGIAAI
jgi:CHAD domain-containing protein